MNNGIWCREVIIKKVTFAMERTDYERGNNCEA